MNLKRTAAAAALVFALSPALATAVDAHHRDAAGAPGAPGAELSDGVVRKVDKDAKKITIKHGPLRNLDMPPMTMVFQVSDPAMLERVKAGDKIRFSADKVGSAYTVTRIDVLR